MMHRPIFVISDLHLGDGGPRDNFKHMNGGKRLFQFLDFLDYVESCNGKLIINGDLFELWQNNISQVINSRRDLLDRLAAMDADYIIGNHDIDLKYFRLGFIRLDHPLFERIRTRLIVHVAGKDILILHGHEQDPYCCVENPGLGRISAIYTGMKEDRNGGPLAGKYGSATVESRTLGRIGRVGQVFRRLLGKPSATTVIRENMVKVLQCGYDAVIFGHTHEPGRFMRNGHANWGYELDLPVYNCGSWAEQTCSYVRIDVGGHISLWDWINTAPVPNHTRLKVDVQ